MCSVLLPDELPASFSAITQPTIVIGLVDRWPLLDMFEPRARESLRDFHISSKRISYTFERDGTIPLTEALDAKNEFSVVMDDARTNAAEDRLLTHLTQRAWLPRIVENVTATRILTFGTRRQGVEMMQHCEAWVGMVAGTKRWLFASPNVENPNDDCSKTELRPETFSCTARRGDVVLVPSLWWHASCNSESQTIAFGAQCHSHGGAWSKDEL